MQNRYVGDVGDFAKHGLLRYLNGATDPEADAEARRFRIGLIWYLTHDQTHARGRVTNGDGQHLGYLMRTRRESKAEYKDCDPTCGKGCATSSSGTPAASFVCRRNTSCPPEPCSTRTSWSIKGRRAGGHVRPSASAGGRRPCGP